MKKITTLLAFCLLLSSSYAQNFTINEAPRGKFDGSENSFQMELPEVIKKEAEDDWKKFIGDFKGKARYDKKTDLWLTEDIKMPQLSTGTVDVYARIESQDNAQPKTTITVWFDMGGAYVNSSADAQKGAYAQGLLKEYAMITSRHHAEDIAKAEAKSLADLERDLKKLKNDNDNYRKEIEKAKETIAKNEKNIEINELDQTNKTLEIEAQSVTVDKAKEKVKTFN